MTKKQCIKEARNALKAKFGFAPKIKEIEVLEYGYCEHAYNILFTVGTVTYEYRDGQIESVTSK